ncbi:MAG: hypothetical protein RPS47_08765 [Colwellia sp.]
MADEIGSTCVDKKADLVIVEENPLHTLKYFMIQVIFA